ncbi:MAG: 3D domain-containing protein, partial [Candidatus Spyradocola sp.]|nr:3D domain-containing protein [Candidatus Spyradocola sp.]
PTPTPTPKPTPKPTATPKKSASPTKTATKTASPNKTATTKSTPDPNKKQASDVTDNTITVDGKTYTYSKTLTVMITAYTHTGRKTSTGVWPSIGTVAVDKSVIPYGTKMYIPGYGFGVAQDTGVSGNHIDVFFDTEAECRQFGRKRDRTIYILD